jgi:hypothetical protein
MPTMNVDDEWASFMTAGPNDYSSDEDDDTSVFNQDSINNGVIFPYSEAPEPTSIYISTKSKIAYLSKPVNLETFWDIEIMPYATPRNGVIKKQIKFDSKTPEELEVIQEKLKGELYYEQQIKTHIDNPTGKIKFKDVRKVSIGISKKDIESFRTKKKNAFLNCYVLRIRLKFDNVFKEFHVKVFNTGKVEVPGLQSEPMFTTVLDYTVHILQPFYNEPLTYTKESDNVLINSNFNCRFYINREALVDIIRDKYNIESIYDPCSYPGIQCTFYYNHDLNVQTGLNVIGANQTKMSFMIFRTGSVLIVGSCDERVLGDIYTFVTTMLKNEFKYICQSVMTQEEIIRKSKKKVPRKKKLVILTGVPEEEIEVEVAPVSESLPQSRIDGCYSENEEEVIDYEEVIINDIKKITKKNDKILETIAKTEVEKEVNLIKQEKAKRPRKQRKPRNATIETNN